MKKVNPIIAIAMALITILSMSTIAFAAPNSGTPIGDETTQYNFVVQEMEVWLLKEDPLWDYDKTTRLYTDDNGTVWRWFEDKNWIVSNENPDYYYRIQEDGTLCIVNIESDDANLTIPSTLDGKTVTRLMRAGKGETTLSVSIPDTVTRIDHFSFRNKEKIKRVIIPDSVKSINVRAFEGTDSIELYYCGTKEQWNDIIVWNQGHTFDYDYWAVTNFDWLDNPVKGKDETVWPSTVKAVHFEVNPDELEPLEPEDKEPELGFFGKIIQGIKNIILKIISIFIF